MSLAWWWYPPRRFSVQGHDYFVRTTARTDGLVSRLFRDGQPITEDRTPVFGAGSTRNHMLRDGPIEVETGYIGLGLVTGIVVRVAGSVVHESHPGERLGYPDALKGMAEARDVGALAPRNRLPLAIDIATGILFFVVAKFTDLTTAALVGAGVGIALLVFERITKIDVTGGLALFGIAMLCISAGIAVFAKDEMWVQLRSTIVGLIAASLFFGDAIVFQGRKLAAAMARYMPHDDLDIRRFGIGMGAVGATLALLNVAVVRLVSKDVWLFYTTFGDVAVTLALFVLMLRWSRTQPETQAGKNPSS